MKVFFTLALICLTKFLSCQDFIFNFIDEKTSAIVVNDFDGDGFEDIFGVQYNSSSRDIYLLVNTKFSSTPAFTQKVVKLNSGNKGNIVAFDYEGDGDMDVLYAKGDNLDMEVFLNDGKGTFTSKPLGISGSWRCEVLDMDKDGDADIVGINYTEHKIYVYYNLGNMQYTRQIVYQDNLDMEEFNTGDLNNDGLPEIAIAISTFSGERLVVMENKGSGTFAKLVVISENYYGISNVSINDINKDGRNDLVITDGSAIRLGINNGNFQFADKELIYFDEGYITGSIVSDVTGEGEKDLVICTSRGIHWLKNINRTDFTYEKRLFSDGNGIFTFYPADFNKDGALDFAYANFGLNIYMNNITQLPNGVSDLSNVVSIYPNPTKDILNIDNIDDENYVAKVFSFNGMQIMQTNVVDGKISISDLKRGHYILSISDSYGKNVTNQIVVKE